MINVSDPNITIPAFWKDPEDPTLYIMREDGTGKIRPFTPDTNTLFVGYIWTDTFPLYTQPHSGCINIYQTYLHARTFMNPPPNWPLRVMWEPGYDTTTKYKSTDTIFVCGDTTINDDEWNDDILLHEFGHYLMHHYAQLCLTTTTPHFWYKSYPNDSCLAYKEGWAHFFSGRARAGTGTDSLIVDTDKGIGGMRAGYLNLENPWDYSTGGAWNPVDSFIGGPWCEGAVAGVLWDIYDSYNEIPYPSYPWTGFPDTALADTLTKGFAPIWHVFDHYNPPGVPTNCWTIFHFRSGWNSYNYGHPVALNQILLHHRIRDSIPAKPTGLSARLEFNDVRLYWRKNTESDLQGYRIYRRSKKLSVIPPPPWSPWTQIAENNLPTDTTYLDTTVRTRYIYQYKLTAFDSLGNESPFSDSVQISIPPGIIVYGPAPDISPEATAYNNSRRFLRDAQRMLHLGFTVGDSVYHTFLRDTTWSEPVPIVQAKYPAMGIGKDDRVYAIAAYNSHSPLFLEELRLVSKDATGWSLTSIPLVRTYDSFLWGVGAPSFVIKDTIGYFVFESTYGPTYHPEPGGPMPQVIVLEGEALIYGRFSLKNPVHSQWQVLDRLSFGPIPVLFDTLVYRDSILPQLISPSITVSPDGVVHILWEGRGDSLRYYRIVDGVVTKQLYAGLGIDYPFITMRGDQIDHFWCEQGVIRHRYGWDKKTNLSQPQTIASCENPFSSGQYLTWTKQEAGISHLYYGAVPARGMINPVEVSSSTDLITHPQILFNPNPASLDLVWTEYNQIDSLGFIYHLNLPLTDVAPIYSFDMGTEIPVPVCVQRDGYIVYGAEDYKTMDYDSTELVYHLTLYSPRTKYKIRWIYYHEERNRLKLQFNIDEKLKRNRWVNPKEKITEEAWIPAACLQDNEVTIKIKRLSGSIAVLSGFEIEVEQVGGGGPQQGGEAQITKPFFFEQIYPNPARGLIRIYYNSPDTRPITLKLYDVSGRHVDERIIKSRMGMNEVLLKPKGLSAGVYFVHISAGDYKRVEKVILLK